MTKNEDEKNPNKFPATVVEVLDRFRIAINRGEIDGIKLGDKFIVFRFSDKDIIDPETNKSLGRLEEPLGTGIVINVQEKMSIIKSNKKEKGETKIIRERTQFGHETIKETTEPDIQMPFEYVNVGDKAKPI